MAKFLCIEKLFSHIARKRKPRDWMVFILGLAPGFFALPIFESPFQNAPDLSGFIGTLWQVHVGMLAASFVALTLILQSAAISRRNPNLLLRLSRASGVLHAVIGGSGVSIGLGLAWLIGSLKWFAAEITPAVAIFSFVAFAVSTWAVVSTFLRSVKFLSGEGLQRVTAEAFLDAVALEVAKGVARSLSRPYFMLRFEGSLLGLFSDVKTVDSLPFPQGKILIDINLPRLYKLLSDFDTKARITTELGALSGSSNCLLSLSKILSNKQKRYLTSCFIFRNISMQDVADPLIELQDYINKIASGGDSEVEAIELVTASLQVVIRGHAGHDLPITESPVVARLLSVMREAIDRAAQTRHVNALIELEELLLKVTEAAMDTVDASSCRQMGSYWFIARETLRRADLLRESRLNDFGWRRIRETALITETEETKEALKLVLRTFLVNSLKEAISQSDNREFKSLYEAWRSSFELYLSHFGEAASESWFSLAGWATYMEQQKKISTEFRDEILLLSSKMLPDGNILLETYLKSLDRDERDEEPLSQWLIFDQPEDVVHVGGVTAIAQDTFMLFSQYVREPYAFRIRTPSSLHEVSQLNEVFADRYETETASLPAMGGWKICLEQIISEANENELSQVMSAPLNEAVLNEFRKALLSSYKTKAPEKLYPDVIGTSGILQPFDDKAKRVGFQTSILRRFLIGIDGTYLDTFPERIGDAIARGELLLFANECANQAKDRTRLVPEHTEEMLKSAIQKSPEGLLLIGNAELRNKIIHLLGYGNLRRRKGVYGTLNGASVVFVTGLDVAAIYIHATNGRLDHALPTDNSNSEVEISFRSLEPEEITLRLLNVQEDLRGKKLDERFAEVGEHGKGRECHLVGRRGLMSFVSSGRASSIRGSVSPNVEMTEEEIF
ncbi:MAG: hypothetical protein EON58_06260 [Alphaproteobacteria bacterium]|nr:MAG: hypothetical protein EON58_06260 [Alphaproteobacteria bacterium]